jgi:putative transport protein
MIELLLNNPLLLLFVVAGIGYPLGRVRIAGSSLGVAAVLFVGLAVGALHPDLKIPEQVYLLGVVLYIYTLGLSNGPSFFASFRRKGLRDNLFVLGMLVLAAGLAALAYYLLDLKPTLAAGMYAGSLTCTPALAGALEYLKSYVPATSLEQVLSEPVVGYSLAYPMGVVGMILALYLAQRLWKVDYAQEAQHLRGLGATNVRLQNRTICVTRPEATRETLHDLAHRPDWEVIFGRLKRNGQVSLVGAQTHLEVGDLVSVIGAPEDLDRVTAYLGQGSSEQLELDRSQLDFRRIFVSNPQIAGHRLRDLNLPQQYGAIVTRLRRGDIEFLPHGDTVLELGNRVRVVTHRQNIEAVARLFGDSYRTLSEIDMLTFSLGLGLGLLLGSVVFSLPGGVTLKLGFAGGPLVVALILGALGRTGPLIWSLPYSANLTLRQIGLILFLAGVGTRAGYAFLTTLTQGGGLYILGAGAVVTCVVALLTLWIGYWLLKIPMSLLSGMLAGLQTQPAVLGFALEQTGNDLPNIGYATVFPVATIAKILLAQVLLSLLL